MSLTDADLRRIAKTIETATAPAFAHLEERLDGLKDRMDHILMSVEESLPIVRRNEEEIIVS
jgi:hypothetical protein